MLYKFSHKIYFLMIPVLLCFIFFIITFSFKKSQKSDFTPINFKTVSDQLSPLYSKSLVIMEEKTGKVVYAKNPDILFPPASLTKLVTLYIIYEKIKEGVITKDTIIPISINAWAKMLPSDSSLMFLEPGQIVTVFDLMVGLAIPSGNDAAIAIAEYLYGSIENFTIEMNSIMKRLGLNHIYFEDANGYSSNNYITAYEFALFSREFINRFPESIEELTTLPAIHFPQRKHYPKNYRGKVQTITQLNHNPLIGKLEGADGLKTGYLGKSGFNVAATVKRGDTRLIAIELGSFAGIAKVANNNRVEDITKLINYTYDNYQLVSIPEIFTSPINKIPVKPFISAPYIYHYKPIHSMVANFLTTWGEINKGDKLGELIITDITGEVISIPLVATKDSENKSFVQKMLRYSYKTVEFLFYRN